MSIAEFFSYLMRHDPSRELGAELAMVYVTTPAGSAPRGVARPSA